jgi:hypothetical protein
MSTTGQSADVLVDEFVRYVNNADLELKVRNEVPQELRTLDKQHGMFHWQIRPATFNPWIKALLGKLPHTFPMPYRSLIERYRFCSFEVGAVMFFANTGQDLSYELYTRVFADKHLFPKLHEHGYLEFGKPYEGSYDPICFDTSRQRRGDAPLFGWTMRKF